MCHDLKQFNQIGAPKFFNRCDIAMKGCNKKVNMGIGDNLMLRNK